MHQNHNQNFQDYIKNRYTLWGKKKESIEKWQLSINIILSYYIYRESSVSTKGKWAYSWL